MSRPGAGAALGLALASLGCPAPTWLTTHTDVVTAADSSPVFGPGTELRFLDEVIPLKWDPAERAYKAAGMVRSVRVARLDGDVHLFQADLDYEDGEGHSLLVARVSREGDALPLMCPIEPSSAARYGVRATRRQEVEITLTGDRAGILGLLGSALPSCQPLTRFARWTPPTGKLAGFGAAPAAAGTPVCWSCPEAACVQGIVHDASGATVPGATIRVEPRSGGGPARTAVANAEEGAFLVTGLGAGSYVTRIELPGFRPLVTAAFTVSPSAMYTFEAPFQLHVGSGDEPVAVQPAECRKGGARAPTKRP